MAKRTTVSLTGNPLAIAERAQSDNTTSLITPSLSEVVAGIITEWERLKAERTNTTKRGKVKP